MFTSDIKDIFEKERFPKSNWQFISLLVYFPFGVLLALLRFFIGFQACLAGVLLSQTPHIRSIVLRVLCIVLGVNVEEVNKFNRSRTPKVIVANCVSKIDYIPLHLATGCVSPSNNQKFLSSLVPGLQDFNDDSRSLASMKSFIEKGSVPLFLQPEETTSGKKCLLKFIGLEAELSQEIQPVSIEVVRPPWANISPTVLAASLPSDIFWFLFTPTTLFKIKYLTSIQRKEGENDEEFVNRIEKSIADSLSFDVSPFTARDKAEYEKKYLEELSRELSHPVFSQLTPPSTELIMMTSQVAEVFPHVPREVIMRDLTRTRSVGLTISNILEGAVQFVPQTPGSSNAQAHRSVSQPSPSLQKKEPVFAKSGQDRMASFAERKAKMIEEARRRYVEKKGIKID